MKRIIYLLYIAFIAISCSDVNENCIALCGGKNLLIVDMAQSEGDDIKTVWSWRIDDPDSGLPAEYAKWLKPLDECKFVDGRSKLLITSSTNAVVLMDIKTKKALFYAQVPMAHSADLLPGGRVAVALSTHKKGNALEIYDVKHSEKLLYRDSLYSGHGVVWNEKRQSLYALGYTELREYKLKNWNTDSPSLERVATWTLPVKSGHDLSPVGEDHFLVSGTEGVRWFNLEDGTFSDFEPLKDVMKVKAVNHRKSDGKLIYTKAEESWWTHNVYQENPQKKITIDSINIYKVRPAW